MPINVKDDIGVEHLDLIWGVKAIAKEIRREERPVFHMLATGQLPAQKVAGRWCASRTGLRAYFAAAISGGAKNA